MWFAFKRLALGISLIVLTSLVLLLSDLGRRSQARRSIVKIAILQHASSTVLDDGITGMIQGLEEHGFSDGTTATIERFNAEADMAVSNAIATQIVNGDYDLVLTSSTPSMQAVANANQEGRVRHVFGIVADPFSAGIGLDRDDPMKHPKHMVGQSTFLPVGDVFRLMKESLPGLTTVGTAWNPAETNSRAFLASARDVCRELGITLLEANVDNTSGVVEAVQSVIARGAQAFWIPGDNIMMSTIPTTLETIRRAGIPAFSITPGKPDRGTFLDVGLDFVEVGRLAGGLAASVLRGTDPATIPIRDVLDEVPRRIILNTLALKGLGEPWRVTDEARKMATILVDETGIHDRSATKPARGAASRPLTKRWNVDLIEYNTVVDVEEAEEGVLGGLRTSGLVEGRDYRVRIRNAQGDMATMNSLVDAAIVDGADLLITFSTPTLQSAIQRSQGVPVVFNYVANAVWAGAGRSDTDHLPNVTGVYLPGAYDEMIALIREVLPAARVLGTLYVPSEVNTVYHRDQMVAVARKAGIEFVTVAANTASEVTDAALSLASRKIDAICQLPGNLTASAFPTIAEAARRARLPLFGFQTSAAEAGAHLVVARDYRDAGAAAALVAVRIMRGESPASIPFEPARETRLVVNKEAARIIGLHIPPSVLARAERVIGAASAADDPNGVGSPRRSKQREVKNRDLITVSVGPS
jgi:ABC-type uncharacterized transport system substrate-binding protein